MALHSLYLTYAPSYKTSNTKRMFTVKAIRPDNVSLFEPISEPIEPAEVFSDPKEIIPGDVAGKDIDDQVLPESLNYVPSIGELGNPFGADKSGANVGDSGRMEYRSDSLMDDPPESLITKAQDVVSLITGPEEDRLEDGRVPDPESMFKMYETIEEYFVEALYDEEPISEAAHSSTYAIPRFKRYPLTRKTEVKAAIRAFPRITNIKDRRIAAMNIVAAYEKFSMTDKIPRNNPLYDLVPDSMRAIDTIDEGAIKDIKFSADWLASTKDKGKKKAVLNHVTKTELKEIQNLVLKMRKADTYAEYKPLFKQFVKLFHIPERGTIICDHIVADDDRGGVKVTVTYSNNTNKIRLPEGTSLYHMTMAEGLTELRPQFRGKATTGYMYDRPRIYFSVKKTIPKIIADYGGTKSSKLHKYVAIDGPREVYVDPLVWAPFQGAVYVETEKPIKVEEVGLKKKSTNESAIYEMVYEDYCDSIWKKLKQLARDYNKKDEIFAHVAKVLKIDKDKLPKFESKIEVSGERQLCFSMVDPDAPFEIRCEYEKYINDMIKDLEKDKELNSKCPHISSIWTADGEGSIYVNLDYEHIYEGALGGVDENILNEGILSLISDAYKRFSTFEDLKKFWNKKQKIFKTHVWDERVIPEGQEKQYESAYKQLLRTDESYLTYQRCFNKFCRLFSIMPQTTIIENLILRKNREGRLTVSMRYSNGLVKVELPDDVELIHVSPAKDIKELIPTHKSKTTGKYFYYSPRVFFTIKKRIAANKAGLENTKVFPYTPKEKIKTVYIDPTYTNYKEGSVFVPTTTPIPVVTKEQKSTREWISEKLIGGGRK